MASTLDPQTQALLERLGPIHPAFSGPGEPRLAEFRAPHAPVVVGSPPVRRIDVTDLLVPGQVDVPVRDDSRRFHGRLVDAGVEATLLAYATIHGFLNFAAELDVAADALADIAGALRTRLAANEPRLQHVALPYRRGEQARARRFYGHLLALDEKPVPAVFRGRDFVWFAAGPGEGEIHLIPADMDPQSDAERHAALALDRLDETLVRLEHAGHPTERYDVIPDGPQAFLHDAFGNLLELTTSPGGGGKQG